MRAFLFAFALSLLLLVPAEAAAAQDSVGRQLSEAVGRLAKSGYRETHGRTRGTLRQGQETSYTLDFTQGRTYAVVGVCDNDCSDLDLQLHDDNGNLVAQDTETDDTPVVSVSPRWTGRFRVTVKMHACSVSPCDFGLLVLTQR